MQDLRRFYNFLLFHLICPIHISPALWSISKLFKTHFSFSGNKFKTHSLFTYFQFLNDLHGLSGSLEPDSIIIGKKSDKKVQSVHSPGRSMQ